MTGADSGPLARNAEYSKIWTVGFLTGIMRWLELLAFGVYAFDTTGSPSLVALLVILRFLPLALFGVFLGALADMLSARRLLMLTLAGVCLSSLAMWALFAFGTPQYWHVAIAAFISGAFWASDFPIRRKMIGDVVSGPRLASGMAIDQATSNGTRALGPVAGGVIYEALGLGGVFGLGVALFALSLFIAFTIRAGAAPQAEASDVGRLLRPLKGAVEAARTAARDGDIARILLVTVALNVWGFPYMAMVPVIGRDDLGLSPGVVGALTSAEGLFALLGALAVARWARPRWYRAIYAGGTLGLLVMVGLLGAAPSLWTLALGLCVGGLCVACFAAMQTTLIYMVAPPGMQGRFLGLMTICIGTGVIGFANVGLTAELFGATNALWIIALEGLIPMALIVRRWPRFLPAD